MSYIIRTSWGVPGAPRDFPAKTAADAGRLIDLLGRDGVFEYEIYGPDGARMKWAELIKLWRTEQLAKRG